MCRSILESRNRTLFQISLVLAISILGITACLSLEPEDAVGTISTIAGTGESGYSGDRGPASEAQLEIPFGLAIDPSGNLYVGEAARIRRIDHEGLISTVAGTGVRGFSVDGIPSVEA